MKHKLRRTPLLFIAAFAFTFLVSAGLFIPGNENGSEIPTVTIGQQMWMAHNLNTTTFQNGDVIPVFRNYRELKSLGDKRQPACGVYDNKPENALKYGRLYNWFAVSDPRGICPEGFRVPTEDDFLLFLVFTKDANFYNPQRIADIFSSQTGGLQALYGGWCCRNDVDTSGKEINFANMGRSASFWSTTEVEIDGINSLKDDIAISFKINTSWLTHSVGPYIDPFSGMRSAHSVRCIKE